MTKLLNLTHATALTALRPVRALSVRVSLGPRPWLRQLRRRSPGFVHRLHRYYAGGRLLWIVHQRLWLLTFPQYFELRPLTCSRRLTPLLRGPVELLLAFFLKGIVVGAATADAVFGIIAASGLTVVSDWLLGYQWWLRGAGGCLLLLIGGRSLLVKPQAKLASPPDPESLSWYYASTFALTLTNPVTVLVFIAVFAAVGLSGAEATLGRAAILVLGVWVGSLLWWLALSFSVGLLVHSFEPRHLAWINRASGAILLVSGAALLASP